MSRIIRHIFGFVVFGLLTLLTFNVNGQCEIPVVKTQIDETKFELRLVPVDSDVIFETVSWVDQDGVSLGNLEYVEIYEDTYLIQVCAEYISDVDGVNYCSSTTCVYIEFDDCIDVSLIKPFAYCDVPYEPVCGCNGITYANVCEAEDYFGVTQYSIGPCSVSSSLACEEEKAYFYPHNLGDNTFEFENMSTCSDAYYIWNFGDDSLQVADTDADVIHQYTSHGVYTVKVTKFNDFGDIEIFRSFAITDDMSDMCDMTNTCIWPGDADGDSYSNMYDVLYLGIANSETGGYRPNASCAWQEQLGASWNTTTNGIDTKYFDGNGDGIVNAADIEVINNNYSYESDVTCSDCQQSGPSLSLVFNEEMIVITDDSPEFITIEADIVLGTNTDIVYDVYGLAFKIEYDDEFISEHVVFDYSNQAFFGSTNEMFTFQKEYTDVGNLDVALSRKNQTNKSGYGILGKVEWIIEADIIEGRATVDFDVDLTGVMLINRDGDYLDVNPLSGTFVFVDSTSTSGLKPIEINESINIFPNPTSDVLNISLDGGVIIKKIKLFNNLGVIVVEKEINAETEILNVSDLIEGVYWIEINTAFGNYNQKVLIKK